jgi:archaellum biogenesis protein FlaJ (TadC family)
VSKSASALATISATLVAAIAVAVLATEPATLASPFNFSIAAAFTPIASALSSIKPRTSLSS